MNRILAIVTVNILLVAALGAFAQNKETHVPLAFKVTGFADDSGQLLVYLFRKEDRLPSDPFKILEIKIENKQASVEIDNLPFGNYACIFIHDKNANNHIDHRFGIPNEPLGYTNYWKLSLFSGMPTFEKLKFTYSASKNNYPIDMDE